MITLFIEQLEGNILPTPNGNGIKQPVTSKDKPQVGNAGKA